MTNTAGSNPCCNPCCRYHPASLHMMLTNIFCSPASRYPDIDWEVWKSAGVRGVCVLLTELFNEVAVFQTAQPVFLVADCPGRALIPTPSTPYFHAGLPAPHHFPMTRMVFFHRFPQASEAFYPEASGMTAIVSWQQTPAFCGFARLPRSLVDDGRAQLHPPLATCRVSSKYLKVQLAKAHAQEAMVAPAMFKRSKQAPGSIESLPRSKLCPP